MNADGTGQTRLTNNSAIESAPTFRPDGAKIAFVSDRDGNAEVYMMNADGTGQARLTTDTASDLAPAFGRQGSIAFASDRAGNSEIYRMNADGSAQTRLTTHAAADQHPSWASPGIGITITQSGGSTGVTEGGATDSYTIVLASPPAAAVTVALNPGTQLAVSGPTVTANTVVFGTANWNVPQTITVSAINDSVAEGAHTGIIAHTSSSADPAYGGLVLASLSVTINDNDTVGITLTESGGSTAVAEGGATDSYSLVLTSQPTANVTIALASGAQLAVSGPTVAGNAVTFTRGNWSVAQTITVAALDDSVAEGSHAGNISHTVASADAGYNGFAVSPLNVTIADNDVQSLIVSPTALTVNEGGSNTFSVRLGAQPLGNVTVDSARTSGDADLNVATGGSLTFTDSDWNTPKPVTISAAEDADTIHGQASFTVSSSGLPSQTVTVTEADNDTAPEIAVERPVGTNLIDGTANADFGPVLAGTSASISFTVRNTGTADLTGLRITIDGANAGAFTETAVPVAPVAPGGNTTFTVQFSPGVAGPFAAVLHLASNDADENPFDIALTGSGTVSTLVRPGYFPVGLQGWWKLDEVSGQRADSSGRGNHLGDVNSVASVADDYWVSGERSADFERDNSEYLSIPSASQNGLSISGSFTLAVWIKPESIVSDCILLGKWTPNTGYMLSYNSQDGGTINSYLNADSNLNIYTDLKAGRWIHLVTVFDNERDQVLKYANGNLIDVKSETAIPSQNGVDFRLGIRGDGSDAYDGLMKDAAVWSRVLTPIEVKSLALGVDLQTLAFRPGSIPDGLVSWWKMDEISSGATPVSRVDSGPGGNHLSGTAGATGGFTTGSGLRLNGETLSRPAANVSAGLKWNSAEQGFTVAGWLYFESTTTTGGLFGLRSGNTFGVIFVPRSPNQMEAIVGRSGSNITLWSGANTLKPGAWQHVALIYDPVADELRILIDGLVVNTGAHAAGIDTSSVDLIVGKSGNDYTVSRVSDLAVWNRALTVAEIKNLATGLPLQRSGIVSYWPLDETSGTRADSLGTNHLSNNNGVGSAPGVVGNAGDFERDNSSFLSIANAAQSGLDIPGALTVLGWVKPESTGTIQSLAACRALPKARVAGGLGPYACPLRFHRS